MWTEPLETYFSRAAGIARARPPPVVTAKLCNQRSVSTLGHVSQFALLPHPLSPERARCPGQSICGRSLRPCPC
eukprot:3579683-Pyramimonas_sp.AAC.1